MGSGSVGVGGVLGIGGADGIIDIRFARRVSVGLIVRAPKPVAWGMVDMRLEDEEGVVTVVPDVFLTGVRTALVEEDREWSVVPVVVKKVRCGSRGEGCIDLALRFRTDGGTLVSSRGASVG